MNANTRKRIAIFVIAAIVAGIFVWAGIFWWNNLRGASPAFLEPSQDIADIIKNRDGENNTELPLDVADNLEISIFAENVPDARVLVRDGLGNFWLSQPDQGTVSLLTEEDGEIIRIDPIFKDLNRPHGLAIDPDNGTVLYIAETDKISRVQLYSEGFLDKITDLPGGGRHFSRTIGFGPDGRLYVSTGSSCDTCVEEDERRASIYSMNKDGSDFRQYAEGLRNAVFFEWNPVSRRMWATEMGRDHLGDDLPPDEVNIIKEGAHYGWPYCYGDQIRDNRFMPNGSFDCSNTEPSYIDIQAHSAPLGLGFVPEEGWPQMYRHDLFVAYHGSWNRTEPTGYKIVQFMLDENGNVEGREDLISGWLDDSRALGRPVDILIDPGGVMYITDDHAGVVYKVTAQP